MSSRINKLTEHVGEQDRKKNPVELPKLFHNFFLMSECKTPSQCT